LTIQRQIRDAMAARISAETTTNVFRAPRRVLPASECPAVCLFGHQDRPENDDDDSTGRHFRLYTVRVEIVVCGEPEDDRTDAYAAAVRRALLADDSLGGLVEKTTWTEQTWDGDHETDPILARTGLDFTCRYLWSPSE
jgi:hypothetical protein